MTGVQTCALPICQRDYQTQKSFNTLSLDERGGLTYDTGDDRFRVGVVGEQPSLGGARDRDTSGLNAEWHHAADASNQLNVFGQYVQYRYADPAMQFNDINQQAAGIGWLHVLEDAKSTLSGSLYYGTENDVGPVTSVNLTGGRPDGAEHLRGLRIGGQDVLGETIKLFFSAGGQIGNFNNVNPAISDLRTDRQHDWTLGASWSLDKLWTVRPQITHFHNSSNVVSYAYDRTDVSLTLRRNFK